MQKIVDKVTLNYLYHHLSIRPVLFFIQLIGCFLMIGCAQRLPESQATAAAETRIELGFEYLSIGELALANTNFERALQLDKKNIYSLLGLAITAENNNNSELARKYYLEAFELAPENRILLNNYGAFLCRLGQYTQADSLFKKANNSNVDDLTFGQQQIESQSECRTDNLGRNEYNSNVEPNIDSNIKTSIEPNIEKINFNDIDAKNYTDGQLIGEQLLSDEISIYPKKISAKQVYPEKKLTYCLPLLDLKCLASATEITVLSDEEKIEKIIADRLSGYFSYSTEYEERIRHEKYYRT